MLDYNSNIKQTVWIAKATMMEISDAYNEIGNSEDKKPLATNIFPLGDGFYDCIIYYDYKPGVVDKASQDQLKREKAMEEQNIQREEENKLAEEFAPEQDKQLISSILVDENTINKMGL